MRFIPEAYDVQAIHVMCKGLFTNTPQAGPYRGAGRSEAAYFTERMIEHAAKHEARLVGLQKLLMNAV
jgi:carbon-monoxide dehydrogenase large subunit